MPGSASPSLGLRLLALLGLLLANAFFVAAEFALVAARRTRIEALARRGRRGGQPARLALPGLHRPLSPQPPAHARPSTHLRHLDEATVAPHVPRPVPPP